MTMKKKILTTLSVVLILGMAALGILAYLSDTDSDVNVMTLGNVQIDQIEKERIEQSDANTAVTNVREFKGNDPWENGKPLYPAVGNIAWAEDYQNWETGGANQLFTDALKNVQDKFVFVENTGKSDAYVRTWFAFEAGDLTVEEINNGLVHWNRNTGFWIWTDFSEAMTATIDGTKYYLRVATYKGNDTVHVGGILPSEETTRPSLLQVFLDSKATNEDIAAFGDEYDILAFSQAVQTDGFATAEEALVEAFGEAIAENHPWEDGLKRPGYIETEEELEKAFENGGKYTLANDITLTEAKSVDKEITLDLNGNTLSTVGLEFKASAELKDGTVASAGNTYLTPHLKLSGGNVEMTNVVVDVNHYLNANVNWTEATGLEIANATAVLNNCDIKIHNSKTAKWVYSYGISLNNAKLTMNGGSITAACVAGTAAAGPTNPNAISTMGDVTTTLKNVDVTATYYVTTVNGHATINTTDKTITSADIVDNRGGSHTINYID